MQIEHIDWHDNRSNLLHCMGTEPAGSIWCNTVKQHKAKPLTKHATSKLDQERSVQLNRTVDIMRIGKHREVHTHQSMAEDLTLSARMHYATSSYSSYRFGFKDSDRASKSANKKQYPDRTEKGHHRDDPYRRHQTTIMVSNRSKHDDREEADSGNHRHQF